MEERDENNDWTPLMSACRFRPDLVHVLLDYHVDIHCSTAGGSTPLHILCARVAGDGEERKALTKERLRVYKTLCDAGLDETAYSSEYHMTARDLLHLAFYAPHIADDFSDFDE